MEQDKDYQKKSKERLEKIATKKVTTTMIGALSSFEEEFGHLWGQGKTSLSANEELMRNIWNEVRKKILDTGNNQIKNLKEEFSQYTIEWNRYQYTILFKD